MNYHAMLSNFTKGGVDDPEYDLLREAGLRGFIIFLYVAVIVLGVLGNSIVVIIVIRNPQMRNVTNIFITNLAISDIALCIFNLPFQLHYQLMDTWIFGETMCRVIFSTFGVPLQASTLSMMAIAMDRYWLIVYPLRQRMSITQCIIIIISIATFSLLLATPLFFFSHIFEVVDPDLKIHRLYCIETWPRESEKQVYSIALFTAQFCIPVILTALIYARIYARLKNRPIRRQDTAGKMKTTKILISIVSVFIICWLPWNGFTLLLEIDKTLVTGRHTKTVDMILKVFAMSSACINPFLYCWLNENFRKEWDKFVSKVQQTTPLIFRSDGHTNLQTSVLHSNQVNNNIPSNAVSMPACIQNQKSKSLTKFQTQNNVFKLKKSDNKQQNGCSKNLLTVNSCDTKLQMNGCSKVNDPSSKDLTEVDSPQELQKCSLMVTMDKMFSKSDILHQGNLDYDTKLYKETLSI
ncbi:unnamed protein product [Owenia fusiformis]|uniref:Uncharacterized protein n=1 Tax=Owenia fusiformis TaxID=6347 RepID=A0A8J1XVV2_OWEFU|nr:unnamed protein product [Owenia fusiformis]